MMAVSHFDDDHVNGLELFLSQYRAKWLVLPYIGLKQRLAHAASLDGDDVSSAATAGFAIDPLGYLAARDLSERVDGVLLIEGGGSLDGVPDDGVPLPEPLGPYNSDEIRNGAEDRVAQGYRVDTKFSTLGRPRSYMLPHTSAYVVCSGLLEFVFYNNALTNNRANRSKQPINVVANEVANIVDHHHLLDPSRPPRRGWRDRLKSCYARHFGYSGMERNNISLCVLSRSLPLGDVQPCAWFDEFRDSDSKEVQIPLVDGLQALLLSGDLTINRMVIDEMRSHFRSLRWQQLRVVQVPHHGSRHSWVAGNARAFPAPAFVQCVPTAPGKVPYPHPSVIADLSGSQVHCANYDQSVVHTYHFDA